MSSHTRIILGLTLDKIALFKIRHGGLGLGLDNIILPMVADAISKYLSYRVKCDDLSLVLFPLLGFVIFEEPQSPGVLQGMLDHQLPTDILKTQTILRNLFREF